MKRLRPLGILACVALLAACSNGGSDEATTTNEPTTDITHTPLPTDEPTEEPTDETDEPTEDPTDETDEPTEDPSTSADTEQIAIPVRFNTSVTLPDSDNGAVISWQTPGETLHVYTKGSSTPGCFPSPIEARTNGEEMEIVFQPIDRSLICTMDYVVHAWEITWDEPFPVTGEMPLTLVDLMAMGTSEDTVLPAEPVEPLG